jgi:nitrogen fixation-related uncharacterized protein
MTMIEGDKAKGFWFRFKIFLWYFFTEPFRQLYGFWYHVGKALNKTIYWVYYILIISIIAVFVGKNWVAGLLLIVLLVVILIWEWKSGYFMNRYREKEGRRIKKVLEETEPRAMKEWREEDNGK